MKKLFSAIALTVCSIFPVVAEDVVLEGKTYSADVMIDREIGPGIRHTRYRLPSYPLNINLLRVDLNNPYNRIETTVANESAKGTERLVDAAKRQSTASHRPVAAANANFWVVASQPENKTYSGTTRNASIRNGIIVTESNQNHDQWDGGTMRTGVMAISYDKTAYMDYCTSTINITSDKTGTLEVNQCNKGVRSDELCMYNSYYGNNRDFMPIKVVGGQYDFDDANDATEVLLDLAEGQGWDSGRDITLTVAEVRTDAGHGRLDGHDLGLVGRGANKDKIAALAPGDKVVLRYSWTYNPGSDAEVTPLVEQAVGGNALVLRNGELTAHNTNETYNSQVYSRTGYGVSQDGKTLYIIVIDKSTDPVYGLSKGCSTTVMCEFAKAMGCWNMGNFDAGGSAQMFINGRIENKTTEGSARAVANGFMVYSIAPEDADDYNTVTRLEFDELKMQAPVYGTFSPKVIAYNRYGAVIDYDYKDFTLSCDPSLGTCEGNVFTAAGTPSTSMLRATSGDATTEREMSVLEAQLSLRVKPVLIDAAREYPVEVQATIGETTYSYNPASITWSVEDPTIADIDINGVLHGIKEGKTVYTGSIGDFSDNTEVTVEIAPTAEIEYGDWSQWTVKGTTGITKPAITADGKVTFTYGSPRDPYVTVTKESTLYSIPDAVYIEFTPSTDIRKISADFRAAFNSKANLVNIELENEAVFEAGKTHKVELPLSMLGDPADIALYPVMLKYLRFHTAVSADYKGEQYIQLGRLYATYSNTAAGVTEVEATDTRAAVSPNPVAASSTFTVKSNGITAITVYSLNGSAVASTSFKAANTAEMTAPTAPGTYVMHIETTSGANSAILLVK